MAGVCSVRWQLALGACSRAARSHLWVRWVQAARCRRCRRCCILTLLPMRAAAHAPAALDDHPLWHRDAVRARHLHAAGAPHAPAPGAAAPRRGLRPDAGAGQKLAVASGCRGGRAGDAAHTSVPQARTPSAPAHGAAPRCTTHAQELGPGQFWVSEAIFGSLFASFAVWTFTPFVLQRKRFYTVVMWSRLLMVLVGEPNPRPDPPGRGAQASVPLSLPLCRQGPVRRRGPVRPRAAE